VAVVHQAIDQRRGHHVAEDLAPARVLPMSPE